MAVSPTFAQLTQGAQFRGRVQVRVSAPPAQIFEAFRAVTVNDMKVAWLLGEIRYLPARLIGRHPASPANQPFLQTLIDGGTLILVDDAPREIITGSAGQLHRVVDQAPVAFASRAAFDAFADRDHEKLFMSIRVSPTGDGRYWLILEHATLALSRSAEQQFRRYWKVIKPLGAFVSRELLQAVRTKAERLAAAAERTASVA
jgi:hypothetical protein